MVMYEMKVGKPCTVTKSGKNILFLFWYPFSYSFTISIQCIHIIWRPCTWAL